MAPRLSVSPVTLLLCLVLLADSAPAQTSPGGLAGAEDGVGKPPTGAIVVELIGGRRELPVTQVHRLRLDSEAQALSIATEDRVEDLALEDLIFLNFPWSQVSPLEASGAVGTVLRILFRTGDEVTGVAAGGDGETLRLSNPLLAPEPLELPLSDLKGWLVLERRRPGRDLGRPASAERRLRDRIRAATLDDDLFLLREGGKIEGLLDSVGADSVRVSTRERGNVPIPFDTMRAALLAQVDFLIDGDNGADDTGAGEAAPETVPSIGDSPGRVTLRDGSTLQATVRRVDGGKLELHHQVLGALTLRLTDILEVAFLGGRTKYLSDLEPITVREHLGPAFVLSRPFQRDSNVLGGPLQLGGRTHGKGLGVHSYSFLEYDLGAQPGRFQAVIGLDDSAHPTDPETAATDAGSVIFRIHLDGKQVFEKALTWKDAPLDLELPLEGGRRLALEVDYGGPPGSMNFALDRANWAAARVVRNKS